MDATEFHITKYAHEIFPSAGGRHSDSVYTTEDCEIQASLEPRHIIYKYTAIDKHTPSYIEHGMEAMRAFPAMMAVEKVCPAWVFSNR